MKLRISPGIIGSGAIKKPINWWVPLNEYFERPNPYVPEGTPGRERWPDSFPDYVLDYTRAPDGNWYQVSLDWVESNIYYNKELFAEAGVEPEWASWGEFIADMHHMQNTLGVDALGTFMAGAGWSNWYWADSVFLSAVWADLASELQMDKFKDQHPYTEFPGLAHSQSRGNRQGDHRRDAGRDQ